MTDANRFHNMSLAQIADEYGDLKAKIAAIKTILDDVKQELYARVTDVPAIGQRWTVTKSESISSRLDVKALRELLGDGLKPYEKESKTVRLLVKPTMILGETA